MPRKFSAVIFDFDDTLVKTRAVKWAQHKAVAKRFYGIDLTDEVLARHWGEPYDDVLRHLYGNADTIENMRAAKMSMESDYPVGVQPGARELVKYLYGSGVTMGVLSATRDELIRADLARLGFSLGHFACIQGSDHTQVHKPDPEVFVPILSKFAKLGVVGKVVYVGDALTDYRAAAGAGIDFIAVTGGSTTKDEFMRAGANWIVSDLFALKNQL